MTPRQAEVAFVMESVEGVRALHAITPGTKASARFDFAIEHDPGGRVRAAVHYALLRVMTHDESARVYLFNWRATRVVAESISPLHLTDSERASARERVPAPVVRRPPRRAAVRSVLVVDDDAGVEAVVRDVIQPPRRWSLVPDVERAAKLARAQRFDLILCDARSAFGLEGLLAKLPVEVARHVLVLATPSDFEFARGRLQGTERILTKPLVPWLLQNRLNADEMNPSPPPAVAGVVAAEAKRRVIEVPPTVAPFSALLVDVDDDVQDALRFIVREEARHLMRHDPTEAAEVALSTPLHFVICSERAALHPKSFLDAIAREDPAGADRVVVVARASDVHYVRHKIAQKKRKNTVLALPVDYTLLRRVVFRDHPDLIARVAVAEVARVEPAIVSRPRFRRLGVLVVDDHATTEILFAAADPHEGADVALATTTMEAFEHVISREVDVLIISATMRGDGGEPFYRVVWRLKPELKSRTVLIASHASPPRVLERPLTRVAIARVVQGFTSQAH